MYRESQRPENLAQFIGVYINKRMEERSVKFALFNRENNKKISSQTGFEPAQVEPNA